MKNFTTSHLLSEVTQSERLENQVGNIPVKEGRDLPNSVTEDIGGFSLIPQYSVKQLKRIEQRQKHRERSIAKSSKRKWRMVARW